MADHKFTYTVSGVELSEVQRTRISEGIAAAVSSVLLGDAPQELSTDYLTLHRIYGGRWLPAAEVVRAAGENSAAIETLFAK